MVGWRCEILRIAAYLEGHYVSVQYKYQSLVRSPALQVYESSGR
jgi:hypothetical protein